MRKRSFADMILLAICCGSFGGWLDSVVKVVESPHGLLLGWIILGIGICFLPERSHTNE